MCAIMFNTFSQRFLVEFYYAMLLDCKMSLIFHFTVLRLTIHTVEDLQKELERKANMADRQLRPNSPDWQASHGTEPLIYSPRHPTPSSAPPRPKVSLHNQVSYTH